MSPNPIYVAIDTADARRARKLITAVAPHVGGIKVGLQFFAANGPAGVRRLAEHGLPLFIDLKFHDIPNTVSRAVQSIGTLGPAIITVHAAGGKAMMIRAKKVAPPTTKVVAVTVLTSLSDRDLASTGVGETASLQVERLARLARSCGLDGIVCSALEVAAVKAVWQDGFFVVPGIRPADTESGDQKRMGTPNAARRSGASILVIGRPITAAADPATAAAAIAATL